jgi:hypothetical protein
MASSTSGGGGKRPSDPSLPCGGPNLGVEAFHRQPDVDEDGHQASAARSAPVFFIAFVGKVPYIWRWLVDPAAELATVFAMWK